MLIFLRVHFKNHMLLGVQAVSVGGAHLTVTSNKSVCSVCWCVQGFVRETVPAINVVQVNGFVIIAMLSHTSHTAAGCIMLLALVTRCCQTQANL
jgi:hypothetical protein